METAWMSNSKCLFLWHMYTMVYHSATKGSEIQSLGELLMDLESVTQDEASQKQKSKYYILADVCGVQKIGTGDLFPG